jgi:hypothetical protein
MQTSAAPLFESVKKRVSTLRMARRLSTLLALLAAATAIAACSSAGAGDATGTSNGGATTCAVEPTFASIYARVLTTPTCAVSGCHATPGQSALSLDGSADAVYHALVDAPSSGSLLLRVAPGAPDASFLYRKLAEETPPSGARMPEGAAPLAACEIDAVKSWIAAGAPKN